MIVFCIIFYHNNSHLNILLQMKANTQEALVSWLFGLSVVKITMKFGIGDPNQG